MPFSESLAERVRSIVGRERGISERKMFGGICFMLHGKVCVGIWQNSLLARVGKGDYQESLRLPFVSEFDITGRPMTGWVLVAPEGVDAERDLRGWIGRSIDFVRSMTAKTKA